MHIEITINTVRLMYLYLAFSFPLKNTVSSVWGVK